MVTKQNELIVSDHDIQIAFLGTNFGRRHDYRNLLASSVMKKAVGYHCGYTISRIREVMLLVDTEGKLTQKGRDFLYKHYNLKDSG